MMSCSTGDWGKNHDYNQNNHYFSRLFSSKKSHNGAKFFRLDFTLHYKFIER